MNPWLIMVIAGAVALRFTNRDSSPAIVVIEIGLWFAWVATL
jgi:hypothetical protein